MSNNKQTALEWLIDQLRQLAHNQSTHLGMGDIRVTQGMLYDFEEQAKEMEKQQMDKVAGDFWNEGASYVYNGQRKYNSFEQYYNEEYGK